MQPKKFLMTANLEYNTHSMETFINLIETVIDRLTKNKSIRFFLKIAVNELVVNAIEHGYSKQGGTISVCLQSNHDSIILDVSDQGTGVQPELLILEKPVESIEDLTERGWGLSILKKVSSNMRITANKPTGTVVSLTMTL